MIENLPDFVPVLFIFTTLATLLLLYLTLTKGTIDHSKSKARFIVLFNLAWLFLQALLTMNGFYENPASFPRLMLTVFPPLLIIGALFALQEGRFFIDGMSLKYLTYIHIVRIPVELVLYWLFLSKVVPRLMTFEGRNFDILAGVSAPVVALFAFKEQAIRNKLLLVWNYIALLLLFNIIIIAVLSIPSTFQKFAFNQPNIAVLHFPFNWLPAFVVPTVLFSHLVSIRQLRKMNN